MAKACAIIASLDPPAMNTDEAGNPPLVRTRVRHVHAGSAAAVQHEHDGARRSVQDRGNVHAILAGDAGHGTRVISEPQQYGADICGGAVAALPALRPQPPVSDCKTVANSTGNGRRAGKVRGSRRLDMIAWSKSTGGHPVVRLGGFNDASPPASRDGEGTGPAKREA